MEVKSPESGEMSEVFFDLLEQGIAAWIAFQALNEIACGDHRIPFVFASKLGFFRSP